jgi:hypothetical protein
MSESAQHPGSFTLLKVAKQVARFLLQEINVLPEYLQRHWDVVFASTTSAAATSAVHKYLARNRGSPGKIELAVFHIIRLFETRSDRKELLAEPRKIISEMDDEVAIMIDRDLITQREADSVARSLKRDVTSGAIRLGDSSPGGQGSIRDEIPTLSLASSRRRPASIPRGGYGLDYDDPELYPSLPSLSPTSPPVHSSSLSPIVAPPLLPSSLRGPGTSPIIVPQSNLDSRMDTEKSKIDTTRMVAGSFVRMTHTEPNSHNSPSDITSTKSFPSTPSSETSPAPSLSPSSQRSTSTLLNDTELPDPQTVTKDHEDPPLLRKLLATIPPPYEPTTKPPPDSRKKNIPTSNGAKPSLPQAAPEAKRPSAPKTAPTAENPKPILRASTRSTRFQGKYPK